MSTYEEAKKEAAQKVVDHHWKTWRDMCITSGPVSLIQANTVEFTDLAQNESDYRIYISIICPKEFPGNTQGADSLSAMFLTLDSAEMFANSILEQVKKAKSQ